MKRMLDIVKDMFVFWLVVPVSSIIIGVAIFIILVVLAAIMLMVPIRTIIKGNK